jgi:hypothetical protein
MVLCTVAALSCSETVLARTWHADLGICLLFNDHLQQIVEMLFEVLQKL